MEVDDPDLGIPVSQETSIPKNDDQVESNNFVCPGFQRIAEEIKFAKGKKTRTTTGEEDDDDNDDETFEARPAKLLKLTSVQNDDGHGHNNGKETEVLQPEKLIISQQEFRQEVLKCLKKFFKYAFTLIVEMRRLCPEDAFGASRAFGIEVPKFLHPSSVEYVDEVSRKLVMMIHRNISEGCVLSIMIEKNKTLHVVQRFIFKTLGTLDFMKKISDDDEEEEMLDIDEVKARCRAALLQLLNSDEIKPVIAPQYSRWSISVGVTNEFATSENFRELWDNDPNHNHFPWKVKPRSLANATTGTAENKKSSTDETNSTGSNSISTENSAANSVQQLQPEAVAVNSVNDCKNSDASDNNDKTEAPEVSNNLSIETAVPEIPNQENVQVPAATASTTALGLKPVDENNKIICFPLSSFSVTTNLMLSIYGLEYPAPIKKFFNSSLLSPRIGRSPSISYRERLTHIRHRLLRQSSHRPRTS